MYRQGDVLLIPVSTVVVGKPVKRDRGRVILAYGELTGHAHAISSRNATLYEGPGQVLRIIAKEVKLEHEEHATIVLPPGDYQLVHQREYSPEEIRRVQD
jgi:hypothetical protein